MIKIIQKLFLILTVVFLTGCVSYPSYQEIESKIPILEEGKGRVFLANPGNGHLMLETKIDKIEQITLAPNTFYYMDLLVGTHELYGAIPNAFFNLYGTYDILIENNKSYYVEMIENQPFLRFTPLNTRVRLLLNADNDDAKRRWQNFGYIGKKIPLNH